MKYFYLMNEVNQDISDPRVSVYLKFHEKSWLKDNDWRIRELEKKEYGNAVWVVLGVTKEVYDKDPSLGCKDAFEAVRKYSESSIKAEEEK